MIYRIKITKLILSRFKRTLKRKSSICINSIRELVRINKNKLKSNLKNGNQELFCKEVYKNVLRFKKND